MDRNDRADRADRVEAGRRTSFAERAVILTAVQSLRLLERRGEARTGFCVIMLLTGGAASGSRYPRLVTGRPYGTVFVGVGWIG